MASSALEPVAAPVIVAGEKAAVTPLGRPETDKAIAELKPFCVVVATVRLAALPWMTVAVLALAGQDNVGTTRVTDRGSFAV